MAPPPELNTDAVSEILLRLPPDDPAGLVRASAVCKPWLRTLTDAAFLRRYRDFHGTPRVLGFLQNRADDYKRFVPTTAFRPHAAATAHRDFHVLDCRHGRVLLFNGHGVFVVWDPVTGHERRIRDDTPDSYFYFAVICAAGAGCDHSTCSGGPFILACVGLCSGNGAEYYACFYSSETGEWSAQTRMSLWGYCSIDERPPVLVGDALYFGCSYSGTLLRYDVLGGRGLLMMELPPACNYLRFVMTAGNGELGLATFDRDEMLVLWSAGTCPDGHARWSRIILIDLQKLLPIDIDMSSAWLSGFAEEANLIFLSTVDGGIFTIDLKSLLARKVSEMCNINVDKVFPYVSFYTPAACARGVLQPVVEM